MSIESSVTVSVRRETEAEDSLTNQNLLTNEQAQLAMNVLMLGITPAVSLIGIMGNFCSILVLTKQNWKKCSNILLLGLAISDIMYLFAFNSVPNVIYTIYGCHSFQYSRNISQVLFIILDIFLTFDYSSGLTSLTLPMLITIERLITIFFPLKVSKIVTPTRTFMAVSGVFVYWYGNFIYSVFWFALGDFYDVSVNRTVYVMIRSELYERDKAHIIAIETMWTCLSLRVPPLVTFVGCLVIGIKIKMASVKRSQLTGRTNTSSMNRTTKTLLAVCGMYTVTCVIVLIPTFIPQYASYSMSEDTATNLSQVVYQIINVVMCINSSCNFVIYIVFNKNFRDTYIALFLKGNKRDPKAKLR